MGASLTIFQKGLILLAVPLLFQLAFFGALYKLELDGEEAQRWAVHTKEVMAQTELAYRYLLESTAYVRRLVITREAPALAPPAHDTLGETPAEFQKLRDLVVDNPTQQAKVEKTAAEAERLRGRLVEALALIAAGGRDQAAARMKDPAVQDLLDAVRHGLDDFLADEGRMDGERMAALHASWQRENWLIGAGAGLSVGIALLIAILFSRSITARLARLTENVGRLRDKKELTQPLSGADEIARLDAVFRAMARALREREQESEMFIYSVSHDLRSPLVNLQGFSEELRLSCQDFRAALDPAAGTAVAGPVLEDPGHRHPRLAALHPHGGVAAVRHHRRLAASLPRRPGGLPHSAGGHGGRRAPGRGGAGRRHQGEEGRGRGRNHAAGAGRSHRG